MLGVNSIKELRVEATKVAQYELGQAGCSVAIVVQNKPATACNEATYICQEPVLIVSLWLDLL